MMVESSAVVTGVRNKRPVELTGGGRGEYCCVPGCKNARYDRDRVAAGIGLEFEMSLE